jgi:hypothetical protein
MGSWYETIDITVEHDSIKTGLITCQEYAQRLIKKIQMSKFLEHNSKYEIIRLFEDVVHNYEATLDDVDVALEMLYDCADEDRVWIKTV